MKCRACHQAHSPLLNCGVARRQREAVEREKNPSPPSNQEAINKALRRETAINRATDGRTPNRRARAVYNEYMRGYMARYRAARRGRAVAG